MGLGAPTFPTRNDYAKSSRFSFSLELTYNGLFLNQENPSSSTLTIEMLWHVLMLPTSESREPPKNINKKIPSFVLKHMLLIFCGQGEGSQPPSYGVISDALNPSEPPRL